MEEFREDWEREKLLRVGVFMKEVGFNMALSGRLVLEKQVMCAYSPPLGNINRKDQEGYLWEIV